MWTAGWRERVWSEINGPWDLIIIGGGITGAGLLQLAARTGLRALLVEANDFAYGTSSRSSKLVHGGLRYLRHAQFRLTFEAVRERERLLRAAGGLVEPLEFVLANYRRDRPPGWAYGFGLALYDLLALKWQHHHYRPDALLNLCPGLKGSGLSGGYAYQDACTDDARLVLRVLAEATRQGGVALNYARAVALLRDGSGRVAGVTLRDEACRTETGQSYEVAAPVVVNATGAWADQLRARLGRRSRLRQLRGSHLVFPHAALPLTRAVSFMHPADRRPVFLIPWEGVTLAGTTDVDHSPPLEVEPAISPAELDYLLAAVGHAFPGLGLGAEQVQATFSGVRAVVHTGKANPSAESREHVLWEEDGLLTVTGGKLTTYRLMAAAAMRAIQRRLPGAPLGPRPSEALEQVGDLPDPPEGVDRHRWGRLRARYGRDAPAVLASAAPGELEPLGASLACWAELRWAARAEAVVHLDDLLLRRVRLGLLLPRGGLAWLERIRACVQAELGWNDQRWEAEAAGYAGLWNQGYSVPGQVGTLHQAHASQPRR